jgi:hypothetical protein
MEQDKARCPQCFDTLGEIDVKTDEELIREIEDAPPALEIKIESTDRLAELEAHLNELERIGSEGPHALEAPMAPPARRRRRAQTEKTLDVINDTLKQLESNRAELNQIRTDEDKIKGKVTFSDKRVPRPDNVRPEEPKIVQSSVRAPLRRVTADALIAAQTRHHLRSRYYITRPAEWLEEIYAVKAKVIGSFPIEVMLGETFPGSDLDICATETAARRLQEQLKRDGYVCTVEARKYAGMSTMKYVRHVETWELPYAEEIDATARCNEGSRARIQFILLTDMTHVAEYLGVADLTVVQNHFDGREFHIGSEETLERRGQVIGDWEMHADPTLDRVVKYHRRGFRIMVPLTNMMINTMDR